MKKILIVEDDISFAERFKKNLELDGYDASIVSSGDEGLQKLKNTFFDLLITDIKMPGMSGIELIKRIRSGREDGIEPDMPIVALTSLNSVEIAVETMKSGAADYITKESERKEILLRIKKVLHESNLENINRLLIDQIETKSEFGELIGESESIRKIKDEIAEVAGSDVSVLISGETGVGKELVARAIHKLSKQKNATFIDMNCAALPDDNLLQSELFGHEKGAFTDAKEMKKGKFEIASGGTLFLDEIGELSRDSQAKILKVIENRIIMRLGGIKTIEIDCRFIFATNKDLQKEVRNGNFREDLYYRVNVFPIYIPPLRERKDDIIPLAEFFFSNFCKKYKKKSFIIQTDVMNILYDYPWYGNVRELRNVIERMIIRAKGEEISIKNVEECGLLASQPKSNIELTIPEEGINLDEIEKQTVLKALEKVNYNQKRAAELLGISVDRMNNRVKKFNIKHPSWHTHK